MKKFIRYLYEYRNGRRVQNVGFVKVEESDDSAVIQIYGKGFPAAGDQALEILLFYPEGNQIIGVPMGEFQGARQMSGYQLIYDSSDVGGWDNFRRIEGVILRQNHSQMPRLYMSTWQERPVDVSNMVERRTQKEELVMDAESRMERSKMESPEPTQMGSSRMTELQSESQMESSRMVEYQSEPQMESSRMSELQSESQSESQKENPRMEESQSEPQMRSSQMSESQMENSRMESSESSQMGEGDSYQESPVVFKIGRQDLVALPRNEWKLANNHFLMHGCRNFHHLLSFEKDGECWLGVPGIYHPKEQSAAHAFGFGQFMKPEEGDVMLSEDEHTSNGEFGYWCRTVSKVIDKSKL